MTSLDMVDPIQGQLRGGVDCTPVRPAIVARICREAPRM
jgi:hypothetical protein